MKKLSVLLLLNVLVGSAFAQKDVQKWFRSHGYLHGLKLNPHQSTDTAEFARQYAANNTQWDKAFAYLRDTDLKNLSVGKHPIDGSDLVASVSESTNKEFDSTKWEGHQKMIDLQYVIAGAEKIGVAKVATAKVIVPYNESKDVAIFETTGQIYTATPGTFFLFFPGDAHRPSITVDGTKCKKIVIKLKVM